MSGKSADVPYDSLQIFPSVDVAIVDRLPLPTAIQRCPGATVFADENAVHFIPSADHAIILPVDNDEYAGPVAMNRLPFQDTDFTPYGKRLLDPGTPTHLRPVYA